MKLLHLADLHLGKQVNGFSMLEDQAYILEQILSIVEKEKPSGILIAGDIYDKPVPAAEAVELLDLFLYRLSQKGIPVFLIYGNHDSPERLAFGGRLMERSGIYLSPVFQKEPVPITLRDGKEEAEIYLLPFLKPVHVRRLLCRVLTLEEAKEQMEGIHSQQDAVRTVLSRTQVDPSRRNILVTHQFVTGASRCESEELTVGGADNVDAELFRAFDYTALGHLHGPQNVGSPRIRYAGSPLKYSFSEAAQKKSVTVVELGEKPSPDQQAQLLVREVPLVPLRDMICLRGSYEELTGKGFYENSGYPENYLSVTLTDEEDILQAAARLRTVYPYLMKLEYDNVRTRQHPEHLLSQDTQRKAPTELFAEFYEKQNGKMLSKEQEDLLQELITRIWEEPS